MISHRDETGERVTMLTFADAANRLAGEGHVRSMTAEGLRKLARTDPEWPIKDDEYVRIAGVRLVPYERVVTYFKTRTKRRGRGPSRQASASQRDH